ncbi:DUF1624 domain-containing protein [Pararhodobacter zhoushanensis]|uniref:DUF1624 domain-containing protein n=1 Tax=Pararhodobacter zhoushanensis TaxID=2479545 RepID=UPI000F8EEEC5|nr:heparan-alpha-glucosaminide N-acetyltransferase [Pararhodobacter zhoushanensis]
MNEQTSSAQTSRAPAIDLARGIALIGMAVFHFTFDLEFFHLIAPGTITSLPWIVFARTVAGSFVFLAGVSLVMAARGGMRWPSFWRSTAVVAVAALGVTVATWFAIRPAFVFFGILHMIVVGRLLGLAFLRVPPVLTAVIGVAVWALPYLVQSPMFNARWMAWIGFAEVQPFSMDLEPVFPWFGPFLLGMAMAGLAQAWLRGGVLVNPVLRGLAWAGRHSLAIYLIHQPVLLGSLWLFFG